MPASAPTVPVATPAAPKVASVVAWPAGSLAAASPLSRAFGISVTTPVSSAAAASDRSVGSASPGAQPPAVPATASSSYMPRFNGRSEDGTYPGGGCLPNGGMATCDPRRLNAWHPRLRVSSASSTPSYLRLLDLGDALCAALRLALSLQRGALSADEVHLAVGFVALPPLGRALCAAALEEPGEWLRLEALPRTDETQHGGRMSPDLFLGLAEGDGGDAFAVSSAGLVVSSSGAVASSAQGPQSDEPPSDEPGTARSVWSRVASAVGSHLLEELCPKRVLSAARSSRAPLVGPFAMMTPSPKTTPFGAKTTPFGAKTTPFGARASASACAALPRTPPPQRSGFDAPRSGLDELHRPLTKLTLRELREVSSRYGATPASRPQKGTAAAHADDLATQLLHLLANRRSPDPSPLSEALGPCVRFPPKLLPTLRRLTMAGLASAGYGPQPAHCLLRAYCDFPAGIGMASSGGAHTAAEGAERETLGDERFGCDFPAGIGTAASGGAHTAAEGAERETLGDERFGCDTTGQWRSKTDALDAALRAALLHTEACLCLADATDAIAAAAAAAATPQPRATPPQPSGAPSSFADVLSLLDQLRSFLRDPKTSGCSAPLTLHRVAGSALAHCVLVACAQLRRLQRRAEAAALLAEAIATEGLPHSFRAPALVQLAQQLQSDGHKQHALQLCEAAHAAGGALSEAMLGELLGSLLPTATQERAHEILQGKPRRVDGVPGQDPDGWERQRHGLGDQAGGSGGGAGASATAVIDLSDEASGDTNGGVGDGVDGGAEGRVDGGAEGGVDGGGEGGGGDGGDGDGGNGGGGEGGGLTRGVGLWGASVGIAGGKEGGGGGGGVVGGDGDGGGDEGRGGGGDGCVGGEGCVGSLERGVVLGESHLLSIRKSLVKLAVPPRRWKKPRLDDPPSAPEVTVWARQLAPEPNGAGNGTRRGRWVLAELGSDSPPALNITLLSLFSSLPSRWVLAEIYGWDLRYHLF